MQIIREPVDGDSLDARLTQYCSDLQVVAGVIQPIGGVARNTFGYVLRGEAHLSGEGLAADLQAGAYFAVPGERMLDAGGATVVLITRYGYKGQVTIGQIEERGRLTYIDGCSDSLIVYPARCGDPTLNHLHFPAGIVQTQHTHPSVRLGIVARGGGHAWGPGWEEPLVEGSVFMLAEHELHSFRTDKSGTTMDVIAFHPDSDFGPTDQAHPMLNRTYIGANPNIHATLIR